MACRMGSQVFVNTVTCDNTTGTTSTDIGQFNPLTGLIPVTDFDRVSAKVELLGYSGVASVCLAVRFSSDGVTFPDVAFPLSSQRLPKNATGDSAVTPPFDYVAFTGIGAPSQRYAQFGLLARKQSGASSDSTRPVATVRVTLDFKSGASATPPS